MNKTGKLLATACLVSMLMTNATAYAEVASKNLRISALEDIKILNAPKKYDKQDKSKEEELLAMGRRIQEEAASGAPVETSLKAGIELPQTCRANESCAFNFIIENTGKLPVVSPVLSSISLGASAGKSASTKTTGWTCGFADPQLTCATTGIVIQPGERMNMTLDWMTPEVSAIKMAKVCFSLVWPSRTKDGVYRAEQIAAVQYALTRAGFETGGIDGRIRPKTLQAIRLLRDVVNIPGPAQITPDLLENLFGEAGKISHDATPEDDMACGEVQLQPSVKIASKGDAAKTKDSVSSTVEEEKKSTDMSAPVVEEKNVVSDETADKSAIDRDRQQKIAEALKTDAKTFNKPEAKVSTASAPDKAAVDKARKEKIASALAPAQGSTADLDRKTKIASALAPDKASTEKARKEKIAAALVPDKTAAIDNDRKKKIEAALISDPVNKIKQIDQKLAEKKPLPVPEEETVPEKIEEKPAMAKTADKKHIAKVDTEMPAQKPVVEKSVDRLEPSASAPKSKTRVSSTLQPGRPVVMPKTRAQVKNAPQEAEDEHEHAYEEVLAEETQASAEPREELVITTTDDEDSLVYSRGAEEADEGSYTVDRGEDGASYTPSRNRTVSYVNKSCACKGEASVRAPRASRSSDTRPSYKKPRGRLPTGAEVVAGWPYRKPYIN